MKSCSPCGGCKACLLMLAEVRLEALRQAHVEQGGCVCDRPYGQRCSLMRMYDEARAEVERLRKGEK